MGIGDVMLTLPLLGKPVCPRDTFFSGRLVAVVYHEFNIMIALQ